MFDNTLQSLPKTKESEIWKYDPAVDAFMMMITEKRSKNESILPVIDEMFVYYTKLKNSYQEELEKQLSEGCVRCRPIKISPEK